MTETAEQRVPPGGEWIVSGHRLALKNADGSLRDLSADTIYRVAIEEEEITGVPSLRSSAAVANVSFARYPVRPLLIIEPELEASTEPVAVKIEIDGTSSPITISGVVDRIPDHIVVENVWYPYEPGALDEIQSLLRHANVYTLGPLTLKQYIDLKGSSIDSLLIEDRSYTLDSERFVRENHTDIPPSTFVGQLFAFQRDGFRWLTLLSSQGIGGILADEMGLGKTIQLIALIADEAAVPRNPSLVVAPATLLENWRREIARFTSGLDVLVHQGGSRTGFPRELSRNHVVITSYDTLVRDGPMLNQIPWNLVILDEAQAIKNSETRRSKAAKTLPRRLGIAVTGTPVENNLGDLWSIVDFSIPGYLGDRVAFERNFENTPEGGRKVEPFVSPIMLRRKVESVRDDLPDLIEIPQPLTLSPLGAQQYEDLRQQILDTQGPTANLVALGRLRRFCTHPRLVGQEVDDLAGSSEKYQRLVEIIEEIFSNGEKALVFTSFRQMIDILVADIEQRFGVMPRYIDGRVPVSDRQRLVDEFAVSIGPNLLALNPRAAGTGLNITSANHVIHYNLEWNPAVEDQATARAYRHGQIRPVTVHRLYYLDTVDEVIADRITHKRDIAESAVIGTEGKLDTSHDVLLALQRSPLGGATNVEQ